MEDNYSVKAGVKLEYGGGGTGAGWLTSSGSAGVRLQYHGLDLTVPHCRFPCDGEVFDFRFTIGLVGRVFGPVI
jgi:hypothetical protein